MVVKIKILGTKYPLRYSVRRVVQSACQAMRKEYPEVEYDISEVKELSEIFAYTQVIVAPGLVINEKLAYDLWIPTREQVISWLQAAIEEQLRVGAADGQKQDKH